MKRTALVRSLVAATAFALTVPLLSAAPALAAADDHLVLSYALDETGGTVAVDGSGHGRDGSIVGGAMTAGSAGLVLDGVNDHVALPADVLAGLDSITVSTQVLVRAEQATPYFIFGLGNAATSNSGSGYLFATGNAYRAGITTGNWSGEKVVNSGANLQRGVWKTLTYTLDDASDTARLYLDGAQVAVTTGVTVKPSELGSGKTAANYIGRSNYSTDRYLAGSVRDFRIYDAALTDEEIAALQPSDADRTGRDAEALSLGDVSAVTSNLTLPATGANGSTVTWASGTPSVISETGVVTRPASGQDAATVTLTATVSRGSSVETRPFAVTVLPLPSDQYDVDTAAAALSIATLGDVRGNLTLPTTSADVTLTWSSSNPAVIAADGVVVRPDADTPVVLTATLTKGAATTTRDFAAQVRKAAPKAGYEGYAFAYFTGNSLAGENIFMAASKGNDALNWNELNGGKPILTSSEGTKGLRDPFLIRSPEGDTFYLIATDLSIGSGTSWGDAVHTGSQYLEVWQSNDLKTWSPQRHIKVAPDNAGMTWAPEAYYDDTIGSYVVFWASALYAADDPGHTGNTYHRMMYATTRDFVTFSDAVVWQDQGVSRIDSTVLKDDGTYYRFTKDEGAGGTGCSDIIQESSTELRATLESWTVLDSCIGRDAGTSAVEGPTAFKANPGDINGDKFYLFVDEYGGRGYIPLETADIANPNWKVAAKYDLPASPRHGTVIPVTAAELEALNSTIAQPPAPAPVNDDGEILRYDFDNGTGGVVKDVSGNGQDGTVNGGATWADGSLTFDGSDDYVGLPDNLLAGVTDVTVEADVWIDSAQSGAYFIYGLGNTLSGAGNGYLFTSGNGYRTSIATGNWTTEQTVSQGTNLPRGQWAHLVYTLEGTTATLYLDGIAVGTATVTTKPGDIGNGSTTANYLGRSNYDGDNRFKGKYREFALYDRALSASEVLAGSGNTGALVGVTLAESDALKTAPIVNSATHEVTFPVKPGTDLTALTPVFSTADGVVATPASGTTQNLSAPVTVTLTPSGAGAATTWTLRAVEMGSPSIPGLYADPNIVAFGDTFYVYATSDGYPGWGGKEFYVWSSKNLVDWTRSEAPILTLDGTNGNVPWASGNAWAPTIAEKDGKFYFYFSGHNAGLDRKTIGVAVADSPEGPFTAQPEAMILNNEAVTSGQAIDPAAFTDPATGKHYLFWGNGAPVYAELSDDMLSIRPETLKTISGLTDFREGSFVNFRDGLYHLTYSIDDTGSENYKVGYATSTSIDGPWTYRGVILQKDSSQGILATGHSSIVNVPGTDDWYIAYHRFAIPGGDGQHRETTIDKLTFDATTGLINEVTPTLTSVEPQTIVDAQPLAAAITGTPRVGETLTASASAPWTATGFSWSRDGVAIEGATGSSYLLTASDVGGTIGASVTASKPLWDPASAVASVGPVLAAGGTGPGDATPAQLQLATTTLTAGQPFTVTGSGFGAGERIEFTLFSTPTSLGSAESDAEGTLTATLTVPAGIEEGAHTLRAASADSADIAEIAVTVKAAAGTGGAIPGSDPAGGSPSGPLASTGLAIGWSLAGAAALVAAGLLLVLRRRRRSVS
ncbi:family 43 glycosylhydrolase [Agreia sp. COWG]|uniref:family 43 glycosylhydrolase n=1 Tax=Agreia sp. COWG TaxID=2773266 RepID=UPI00192851ED|nr:family 43 glycosylhydrolase [Agreia sp. COWG]CAD6011234.1 Glycosyl hydrolases family 43 [Agreia sp. COWG]